MSNPPWATSESTTPMESTSRASSRSAVYNNGNATSTNMPPPARTENSRFRKPAASSRSTCPWDQNAESSNAYGDLPSRVRKSDNHDTCPWSTSESDPALSRAARRPSKLPAQSTSPWAVEEDERHEPVITGDEMKPSQESQNIPPGNTTPMEDDQLSGMKRELVMKMMAEECSEEQILDAMEKLDIQYGKTPQVVKAAPTPVKVPTTAMSQSPFAVSEDNSDRFHPMSNFETKKHFAPPSPSAASVQSTQYEEACTAARATAAKSQGQGVASVFYG